MEDTPKPSRTNPKKSGAHKLRSEAQLQAAAAHSETMRRNMANPEVRKRMREGIKLYWANPEVRRRRSESSKRAWASDATRREQTSERFKRVWAERRSKLAAALPADWRDKSPLWRILAIELLSQDHMSNSELAGRLDDFKILKCPYAQTWKSSVNQKACSEFMRRVRSWVGKPGKSPKSAA